MKLLMTVAEIYITLLLFILALIVGCGFIIKNADVIERYANKYLK